MKVEYNQVVEVTASGNTAQDWLNFVNEFKGQALLTRLKIPLLYGIDAVHGHNNVLGAVIFPHNIGLGCTRNPELVERAERALCNSLRRGYVRRNFPHIRRR